MSDPMAAAVLFEVEKANFRMPRPQHWWSLVTVAMRSVAGLSVRRTGCHHDSFVYSMVCIVLLGEQEVGFVRVCWWSSAIAVEEDGLRSRGDSVVT